MYCCYDNNNEDVTDAGNVYILEVACNNHYVMVSNVYSTLGITSQYSAIFIFLDHITSHENFKMYIQAFYFLLLFSCIFYENDKGRKISILLSWTSFVILSKFSEHKSIFIFYPIN